MTEGAPIPVAACVVVVGPAGIVVVEGGERVAVGAVASVPGAVASVPTGMVPLSWWGKRGMNVSPLKRRRTGLQFLKVLPWALNLCLHTLVSDVLYQLDRCASQVPYHDKQTCRDQREKAKDSKAPS